MLPLGFRDPFSMRQPKIRGAAVAPVAERKNRKTLSCILFLVRKANPYIIGANSAIPTAFG
jgi:hypothetical protein